MIHLGLTFHRILEKGIAKLRKWQIKKDILPLNPAMPLEDDLDFGTV